MPNPLNQNPLTPLRVVPLPPTANSEIEELLRRELGKAARPPLAYYLTQFCYGLLLLATLAGVGFVLWQAILSGATFALGLAFTSCFGLFGVARLCLARLSASHNESRRHRLLAVRSRLATTPSLSSSQRRFKLVALDYLLAQLETKPAQSPNPENQFRTVLEYLLKKFKK